MKKIKYILLLVVSCMIAFTIKIDVKADSTGLCIYESRKYMDEFLNANENWALPENATEKEKTNIFLLMFKKSYIFVLQNVEDTSDPGDDDDDRISIYQSNSSMDSNGKITYSVKKLNKVDDFFPYIKDITKCNDVLSYYKYSGKNGGVYKNNHFYILKNSNDSVEDIKNYIDDKKCDYCKETSDSEEYNLLASNTISGEISYLESQLPDAVKKAYEAMLKKIGNDPELQEKVENMERKDDESGSSSGKTEGKTICVDHTKDVACGSLYNIPSAIPKYTTLLMNLIKILTPIALIIKGIIDLFKAITGNNEQEIEKAKGKFIKRLIPAIIVFLVILIAQAIFNIVGTSEESGTITSCISCFINNKCQSNNTPEIIAKNEAYCNGLNNDNPIYVPGGNGGNSGISGANDISNNGNTPQSTGRKTGNCTAVNVFNKITYEQAKTGLSNAISSASTGRDKAVAAANYLATNFPNLPYHWGGYTTKGIDETWGSCKMTSTASGHNTAGTYQPYGMDCSGFVSWVMTQAGYKSGHLVSGDWGNIVPSKKYEIKGKKSTYLESLGVKPGDLLWHSGHIGIIIGKDSKGYIIAHERGYNNSNPSKNGLVKEYLDDNISPNGKGFTHVILMDDYYKK